MSSRPRAKPIVDRDVAHAVNTSPISTTSGTTVFASQVEAPPATKEENRNAAKLKKQSQPVATKSTPALKPLPTSDVLPARAKPVRPVRESMFDYLPMSGVSFFVLLNFALVAAVVYFLVLS